MAPVCKCQLRDKPSRGRHFCQNSESYSLYAIGLLTKDIPYATDDLAMMAKETHPPGLRMRQAQRAALTLQVCVEPLRVNH
jgi:hypothetical protein